MNERVRTFLDNINNDSEVESNLSDLKVVLSSLNSGQVADLNRTLRFGILFDCLNTSSDSQILLTCEVLRQFLPRLPARFLTHDYKKSLQRALNHPETQVKVTILDMLLRVAGTKEMLESMEEECGLLFQMAKCLCHEDVSIGKRAVDFFIELGKSKRGLDLICQPELITEIIECTGDNNIYVLRVFDVVVETSCRSSQALDTLEKEGLLDRLATFLQTEDVLAALAVVELCAKMAVSSYGLSFLQRHGIVNHLLQQLSSFQDDPLTASLAFPGLAKFFGVVGQAHPSILLECYPEVINCAFKAVDSDDLTIFVPALELIGTTAYSSTGKLSLQKLDERWMRHVMGRLYHAMTHLPSEWRIRVLHSLANLIHLEVEDLTGELMRITETWFNQLGVSGMTSILQMAQQPFPDVKAAAFLVLLNLASQKWGQQKIRDTPDLFRFLLDRRTENEAEGLQMKYDIIKTMVKSGTAALIFERQDLEAMLEYEKQGPFYAEAVTQVVIEGAE